MIAELHEQGLARLGLDELIELDRHEVREVLFAMGEAKAPGRITASIEALVAMGPAKFPAISAACRRVRMRRRHDARRPR